VSINGYGISIRLPGGWDGRLYSRPLVEPSVLPEGLAEPFSRTPSAQGGAATLQIANFTIPAKTGDFGTGATARMPRGGVFAALVEYQRGQGLEPGRGLFESREIPVPLAPGDFDPQTLLLAVRGQEGVQRFFSVGVRPLCLYAVIDGHAKHGRALAELNQALTSLAIFDSPF
jgi:hypothetical protein